MMATPENWHHLMRHDRQPAIMTQNRHICRTCVLGAISGASYLHIFQAYNSLCFCLPRFLLFKGCS